MSASSVYPPIYPSRYDQDVTRIYSAPSKLVQMQAAYRKKLQEEKEQKLLEMQNNFSSKISEYKEDSRQNSLVRDFFLERRTLQESRENLPEINQHYKQKRFEYERQQGRHRVLPSLQRNKTTSDYSEKRFASGQPEEDLYIRDKPPLATNFISKIRYVPHKPLPAPVLRPQEKLSSHTFYSGTMTRGKNKLAYINNYEEDATTDTWKAKLLAIDNPKQLTPIEVAKLHQLKRKKQKVFKTENIIVDETQNGAETGLLYNTLEDITEKGHSDMLFTEGSYKKRLPKVQSPLEIQQTGKVSSYQKWQQDQEDRKRSRGKGIEDTMGQNNSANGRDDNENGIGGNKLGYNKNNFEKQTSRTQKEKQSRGTGDDIFCNNVRKRSAEKNISGNNGNKEEKNILNFDGIANENLKQKKMAILKNQNMKMQERAFATPTTAGSEDQNDERNYEKFDIQAYNVNVDRKKRVAEEKRLPNNNAHNNELLSNKPNSQHSDKEEKKHFVNVPQKRSAKGNKLVHIEQHRESSEMYAKIADAEMKQLDDGVPQVNLKECSNCGRKFAADRLQTHIKVCVKSTAKKRKVFDPVKMRIQGTEHEKYVDRVPDQIEKKPSQWKKKHEDFINILRYAKKAKAAEAMGIDIGPPPVSENADYVQCPHCGRRFNSTAAERHIPKCNNIKSRPPPPPKYRK